MNKMICAVALCIAGAMGLQEQKATDVGKFFALTPGTYWVYQGTVRWEDPEEEKPGSADVTWKMTVERVIRKKDVVAAVVTGFPADLDWSGGKSEPKPWLIVENEKHEVYYENLGPEYDLTRLNGDDHVFDKFQVGDNLLLQWPLRPGAKFCDEEAKKREDEMYCWVVGESKKKKLENVKGGPAGEQAVYRMQYRTLPDDTTMEVVEGVGLVSYEYHHHGTVADTELQLVEFHPGTDTAESKDKKNDAAH